MSRPLNPTSRKLLDEATDAAFHHGAAIGRGLRGVETGPTSELATRALEQRIIDLEAEVCRLKKANKELRTW